MVKSVSKKEILNELFNSARRQGDLRASIDCVKLMMILDKEFPLSSGSIDQKLEEIAGILERRDTETSK